MTKTHVNTEFNKFGNQHRHSALWTIGVVIATVLCFACYWLVEGSFVKQMVLHIALMGPVACLASTWLVRFNSGTLYKNLASRLWLATCIQLAVFLMFHLPFNLHNDHNSVSSSLMMLLMFIVAVWFWSCTFCRYEGRYWQSMLALLITGKTFCLVAVLMIFSPRAIYGGALHMVSISEQQLAGLLMVVACPMSYILAAVVLCVRWLNSISHQVNDAVPQVGDA